MKRKLLSIFLCLSLAVAFAAPSYAEPIDFEHWHTIYVSRENHEMVELHIGPASAYDDYDYTGLPGYVVHATTRDSGLADPMLLTVTLDDSRMEPQPECCNGAHAHGSETEQEEVRVYNEEGRLTSIVHITVCAWCDEIV